MKLRSHKIALDPTNKQRTGLAKAAGTARFAYNWALARWNAEYEEWKNTPESERGKKPSRFSLDKELNSIKKTEFPWMMESTKCAPQIAIMNLDKAFQNAFSKRAKFPHFKKKGRSTNSFGVANDQIKINGKKVRVPKIGWVRMRETLRWSNVKILSATFSEKAGKWFVSFNCEVPDDQILKEEAKEGTSVGIDLGVREYATSDGELIEVPRSYRKAEKKLRRAQKSLSRKSGQDGKTHKKASNNWKKQQLKVAKIHRKVADVRSDWLHKLTNDLAYQYSVIGIEDLNVSGMSKNHRLAKSILDAGFGEFRRQLSYKIEDHKGTLIVASRWYPSSKTCSVCGVAKTKQLPLSIREWKCSECGTEHHRDINAAINLRNLAVGSTVSACGEFFTSDNLESIQGNQVASVKQESDSNRKIT